MPFESTAGPGLAERDADDVDGAAENVTAFAPGKTNYPFLEVRVVVVAGPKPNTACHWDHLPCSGPATAILVVIRRRPDLSPEDGVAYHRVEQHQRKNENTSSPEHEGETGMRRRRVLDRDRERDHVRPERDRQGAERRRE